MNNANQPLYHSLTDIQTRKDELRKDMKSDSEKIKMLWSDLFKKPSEDTLLTPTRRFSGLLNTGAGILDGVILGWKLYRKFRGKSVFKTKRR